MNVVCHEGCTPCFTEARGTCACASKGAEARNYFGASLRPHAVLHTSCRCASQRTLRNHWHIWLAQSQLRSQLILSFARAARGIANTMRALTLRLVLRTPTSCTTASSNTTLSSSSGHPTNSHPYLIKFRCCENSMCSVQHAKNVDIPSCAPTFVARLSQTNRSFVRSVQETYWIFFQQGAEVPSPKDCAVCWTVALHSSTIV